LHAGNCSNQFSARSDPEYGFKRHGLIGVYADLSRRVGDEFFPIFVYGAENEAGELGVRIGCYGVDYCSEMLAI
jgi:hypothetical protein